jgi:methyl-accepting chemotaxis protein
MGDLGKELQSLIRGMERLRDSQQPPDERVLELLDRLCQQKLDLIKAGIDSVTGKYQEVFDALREAADGVGSAIEDLAELEGTLRKINKAVGKIARLID